MADLSHLAPLDLGGARRIHLVGVAGAGMSALAKLLSQSGLEVSGSDLRDGIDLRSLADLGITTWAGHRPDLLAGVDLVVASSAVPEDDPELVAAADLDVPVWRRPDLLNAISRAIPTLGATGTHGKTTTTAFLALGARAAGLDPSFVIGGELVDLATNAHRGSSPLLVLEVDEAFGTFEHLTLAGLVVTNIEAEHLDYFGTVEAMESSFLRVASSVRGPVVCCVDDPGAARIRTAIGAIGYGFSTESDWRIAGLVEGEGSVELKLVGKGREIAVHVPRRGRHVAANAAGAISLLAELGLDPALAAAAIANFRGVKRRFEHRGTVAGVTFIDDYAHHPTEVAATIAEARHRPGRLWAVFQPHLYSRTERLHRQFGQALAAADRVVVTDVYAAREAPIPGVSGELVAAAAQRLGAEVSYVAHRSEVAELVAAEVAPGDTVLSMGAGDITLLATELGALLGLRHRRPER
ncbi:MAG: UDP-N-acetylmuramate--L-alanine ligase [Actinomycetota bacterium]